MKARPIIFGAEMVRAIRAGRKTQTRRVVKPQPLDGHDVGKSCPYGKPGDLLWVREAFEYTPDGIEYRATEGELGILPPGDKPVWRSPIHMPRWASRLTLRVTDARVERLQEISDNDAIAEGCRGWSNPYPGHVPYPDVRPGDEFAAIWESIHGRESWEANPWVWVIEFEPIHSNVDRVLAEEAAA